MFNLKRSYSLCCVDGLIDTIQRSVSLRSNLSVVTIFRSSFFEFKNTIHFLFHQKMCNDIDWHHTGIISVLSIACRYSFKLNSKLLAVWRWVLVFRSKAMYWLSFLYAFRSSFFCLSILFWLICTFYLFFCTFKLYSLLTTSFSFITCFAFSISTFSCSSFPFKVLYSVS